MDGPRLTTDGGGDGTFNHLLEDSFAVGLHLFLDQFLDGSSWDAWLPLFIIDLFELLAAHILLVALVLLVALFSLFFLLCLRLFLLGVLDNEFD